LQADVLLLHTVKRPKVRGSRKARLLDEFVSKTARVSYLTNEDSDNPRVYRVEVDQANRMVDVKSIIDRVELVQHDSREEGLYYISDAKHDRLIAKVNEPEAESSPGSSSEGVGSEGSDEEDVKVKQTDRVARAGILAGLANCQLEKKLGMFPGEARGRKVGGAKSSGGGRKKRKEK
jgi:hypothetical protein